MNMQSKYLKAILWPEDLFEHEGSVLQQNCYTVQDYKYHCYRKRDEYGNPNGAIFSDYLEFSVIASSLKSSKTFYKNMDKKESTAYTFIFNATFNPTGRLNNFEDGIMVRGYVIDVEESCTNDDISGDVW